MSKARTSSVRRVERKAKENRAEKGEGDKGSSYHIRRTAAALMVKMRFMFVVTVCLLLVLVSIDSASEANRRVE